jgi:regulation of enolase protein 1 (concanavalin A-like superfamily)
MKTAPIILMIALLFAGCTSQPPQVNKASTPFPSTKTPIPPEAVAIDKQTNVSFSSYSKEWPVGWQWIDPDEKHRPSPHDTKSGVLRVTVPTGKDMYGDLRNAPRYLKPIKGDFQIETRVKFLPRENYQGAGLLIFKDDNNFIRFERAYGGIGGGGDGIRIDVQKGTEFTPIVTPSEIVTDLGEIEMKIVRTGRLFIAYWREDDEAEWREAGEFESDYPETIQAGVVACNTAREITAEFAFIRLLPGIKPQLQ